MKRRRFLSLFGAGAAGSAQVPSRAATQGAWQPKPGSPEPGTAEETLSRLRPLGGESPFEVADRAQLFVDRLLVWESRDVSFTLHPAQKHPSNPILKADRPWEGWRLVLFGNAFFDQDEGLFKMWYGGESGRKSRLPYFPQTEYNQSLYAVSRDGIVWEKPLVGTVAAARGEPYHHNCIAPVEIPNVFKDRQDPDPQRRYKMVTFIGDPREGRGYYSMVSRDGLEWNQYSASQIAPSRDWITGFYDERRKLYVAYPKIGTLLDGHVRRVYYVMISTDFRRWSTPVLAFAPDHRDDAGSHRRIQEIRRLLDLDVPDEPALMRTEFYGLGFYLAEDCTLGFPWMLTINNDDRYGNQEGISEIQLAVSRDLVHWERPFRVPCIPRGESGEWDTGFFTTQSQAFRVGDEIWLYYAGSNYSHGCPCFYETEGAGQGTRYTGSIGLARWKLDRFVSADGPPGGGTLTTIPIVFTGQRLEINGRTRGRGEIRVRILDGVGKPLEGVNPSQPFRGDELRHTLRWQGEDPVPGLQGRPVTLSFDLRDAELYSFAFRKIPA